MYREFTVNRMTTVTQLKRRLKRRGITQERVAREAKVDRTMVNKVLNARAKSRPVMFVIERLLAVGAPR